MRFLGRAALGLVLSFVTVALLAYAGFVIYEARNPDDEEAQRRGFGGSRERVYAVTVTKAQASTVIPQTTAFGEVASRLTLNLRSSQSGRVIFAHPEFAEGGIVEKGELILRLDPTDAQAALLQAQADAADAEVETAQAIEGVSLAQEELLSAQEQSRLREAAFVRQEDLAKRGIGSAAAVENAELALSTARQSVLIKSQAVNTANARIEQAKTRQSRADLNVEIAQRNLGETEMFAPFSGTLTSVSTRLDGLVGMNEQVAQLIDVGALEVATRLSTAQYTRLLNAQGLLEALPTRVLLDSGNTDVVFDGVIDRESPQVGTNQTGRLVYVRLLDNTAAIKVGDFVTVEFQEPALDGVIKVPSSSIGGNDEMLIVGEEDRLELVSVRILRRLGNQVYVDQTGLLDREYVEKRTPALGAGIKVKPIRRDASGALITPKPDEPRGQWGGGQGKGSGQSQGEGQGKRPEGQRGQGQGKPAGQEGARDGAKPQGQGGG